MPALILFQYLLLNPVKNLGLRYPLKRISGSCLQECCPWKPLPVVVDTWDSLGFRNLSFSGPKCPEAFIGVFLHILGLALVLSWLPLSTTAKSCTERASRALLGGGVQCSTGSFRSGGEEHLHKGCYCQCFPFQLCFQTKAPPVASCPAQGWTAWEASSGHHSTWGSSVIPKSQN